MWMVPSVREVCSNDVTKLEAVHTVWCRLRERFHTFIGLKFSEGHNPKLLGRSACQFSASIFDRYDRTRELAQSRSLQALFT